LDDRAFVLVLDFFRWLLVHLVQHKTSFLWRFHVVHHSDNNVDVTTACATTGGERVAGYFLPGGCAGGGVHPSMPL
jgi:sterol desaturase/sphingolipid hydroxylase (fatty acid hydroxylase superfamily)